MSRLKHTPGPWHVAACTNPKHAEREHPLCLQVRTADGQRLEPTVADLRLQAAAPELLAACEEAFSFVYTQALVSERKGHSIWAAHMRTLAQRLFDATAKAKGERAGDVFAKARGEG